MHTPRVLRPLTADARPLLPPGLRSSEACTGRRCHLLLASAEGPHPPTRAPTWRCPAHTVRQALHAFHPGGVAALRPPSARPPRTPAVGAAAGWERRRALRQHRPRTVGPPTSRWPLARAAEVSGAPGLPPRPGRGETRRPALHPLGGRWQRAPHGSTSPDPASGRNTHGASA
jgi:hypothetical protein